MKPKVILCIWLFLLFAAAVQKGFAQYYPPPGPVQIPVRSGLFGQVQNNDFLFTIHTIVQFVLDFEGKLTFPVVFSTEKEILDAYMEKVKIDGAYTYVYIIIQYYSGTYARVELEYKLGRQKALVKDLIGPPEILRPNKIAGDDLYCFIGNSVYVLRDQVNGPWLIDTAGLPDPNGSSGRTLYDMNIDSFQNVWLVCNNRLYMQPLVSNTWTRKNNLGGNYRLFIDRFQKIWLGRFGEVRYSIDQGTTILPGPAGIGSGEAILSLSTAYNGDVYIITYSFYPISGGGNKIYRSAGGTADFVRIDQNLAPEFAKIGTNQIYNGILADSGVYVAHGSGLHFSNDSGTTWEYIPGSPSPTAYSVIPTNDQQLMMTSPAGAYKGNSGNWIKKHPSVGYQNNINLFRAGNGDIYARSETFTYIKSGEQRLVWLIYKSTDNGNSFVVDTAGLYAANVAMSNFYVDETGTQHTAGSIYFPGTGNKTHLWKKLPGQPWALDMDGIPAGYNPNVQRFTGDGYGNIHCHILNARNQPVVFTRTVNGNTWTEVAPLGFKRIHDQAGRADGVSVFASIAPGNGAPGELTKKTGNSYTNIPLPNGITAADITLASVTFDSSGALWAFFSQYSFSTPNAVELGAGLFYTTDFVNWNKPSNDVDTSIFRSIEAIGDSVFAIPQNFAGVYVFKKLAAVTIYTFTGSGNWSNTANWSNGMVPPTPLTAGAEIIINPAGSGECNLDILQNVSAGGKLTVAAGKKFRVNGNLSIQ